MKFLYLFAFLLIFLNSCKKGAEDEIEAETIIARIADEKPVMLEGKTITGKLDFTKAGKPIATHLNFARTIVEVPVTFHNCTFRDSVIAYRRSEHGGYATTFMHNLSILKCNLNYGLNVRASKILGDFNFVENLCYGKLEANAAHLKGKRNSLSRTRFIKEVNLDNTLIDGSLRAMRSHFEGGFSARRADFRGDLVLGRCIFPKGLELSANRYRKKFRLVFGELGDKAELTFSEFLGKVDLSGTKADSVFHFHDNTLYTVPVRKGFDPKTFRSSANRLLIYSPLDSIVQP